MRAIAICTVLVLVGCAGGEPLEQQDARVTRLPDGGRQGPRPDLGPPIDAEPADVAVDAAMPSDLSVVDAVADAAVDAAPCVAQPETCDGTDEDCDGRIDESAEGPLTRRCYDGPEGTLGNGLCAEGASVCVAGVWGPCDGQVGPAEELCDAADNDCDGVFDEGEDGALLNERCYDGPEPSAEAGLCRRGHRACVAGAFGPCQEQVLPSQEICDGLDNDCDGVVDDVPVGACTCEPGAEQACYGGAEGTEGVGVCQGGRQICDADGQSWGVCAGAQLPHTETCDNTDEDCDGAIDETVTGTDLPCTVGRGACMAEGLTVCDGDRGEVVCAGVVGAPEPERCNGLDDDCDGQADEGLGLGAACSAGLGVCRAQGAMACAGDAVGCDAQPGAPGAERCNGLDDDCDGAVDEGLGLGEACTEGTGECARAGVRICRGDVAACSVDAAPGSDERCNGLDDDCDGLSDEGDPGANDACPAEAQGACGVGESACLGGRRICRVVVTPGQEICNNIDDDCDGITDEAPEGGPLREACYGGIAGTQGVAPCRGGERLCGDGAWGACLGQQVPAPEICDGIDNDCDGVVDDVVGVSCVCEANTERPCYPGAEGTEGVGVCAPGNQRCRADGLSYGTCAGAVVPSAELCNGQDDDCNDVVDDVPELGAACTHGVGACVVAGARACSGGELICDAEPAAPGVERCDGRDGDCNGVVDDAAGVGDACAVGVGACARLGEIACLDEAAPGCNAAPGAPGEEICNDLDDDCDGSTDEGLGGAACAVGEGVCQRAGVMACLGGVMACDMAPGEPAAEICNGLDDDCDGTTDEETVGQPCTVGVGACQAEGHRTCEAGVGACDAQPGVPGEEICGGADEDCDGQLDEGLACDPHLSCETARQAGNDADGVYVVQPASAPVPVNVWCDQTTDGGGWTLVGSTRGTTLNDAGGAWYPDLTTLAPAEGHEHMWDGLRDSGLRHDVRFVCRDAEAAADAPMTVDLTFEDVTWYRTFTTGADGDSCFSESQGHGIDLPQPARRNNLTQAQRPLGSVWAPINPIFSGGDYLEGEDTCDSTSDFTVDFNDRGMDSEQADGTDWGEDDSARKCGRSDLATGQWFVYAREVRTPALRCPDDDPFEDNDTGETGTAIRLGPTWHGILCAADHDWFTYAAAAGRCYRLTVGFKDALGDIDARVVAATGGAELAVGRSVNDNEVVDFVAPDDGLVQIDLSGFLFGADGGNDYTLTLDSVACPTP